MDIGENVTAILCVIVGILIIGTALVPIVEHASGSETTEVETGLNTRVPDTAVYTVKAGETITYSLGDGLTVNGTSFTMTSGESGSIIGNELIQVLIGIQKITIYQESPKIYLSSGTVTVTSGNIAVTGVNQDDSSDYSTNIAAPNITISGPDAFVSFADDKDLKSGLESPARIGDGQTLEYIIYVDDEETAGTITTSTISNDNFTLTHNDDGTITAVWNDADIEVYGPVEWSQTVTTSEGSQYAALYGIIPIMCILGMGYVLIRRF